MNAASATVTVTASSPTITYGDATPTITASYSGLLGGDTSIADVTCSIEGYTGHAGTYTTECTGPNSTNDYSTITYATGTLTVNAASATVTVTASSPTITYGDATPTITASYSGLLGGDTSIADVTCSIEGYTGHAGTYTTECTGPNSTNDYSTIAYATGTLTVNAASATVTVTASSPTITYGDATPTITASYSGLLGGDTSIADVTCSIEGYTGHAGTYTTECTGRTRPTTTARSPTPRAPSR